MKVPELNMRVAGETAFCGRCGEPISRFTRFGQGGPRLNLKLDHTDRMGWVEVVNPTLGEGRSEYALLRRRRPSRLTGAPVNIVAAFAMPGDVVRCPNSRCAARQVVPPLH